MSTAAADGGGGDGGGGDGGAPTTLPPQPSPSAHPVQEKISRSGEPLTLTTEMTILIHIPVKKYSRTLHINKKSICTVIRLVNIPVKKIYRGSVDILAKVL